MRSCMWWSITRLCSVARWKTARRARSPAWVRSPPSPRLAILRDSWVSALITDGCDIKNVTGLTRTIPARVRRALEARGRVCGVPGCGRTRHLVIDHTKEFKYEQKSELANLDWLCPDHNYLKTFKGWILTGPYGNRTFTPPPTRAGPGP